MLHRMLKIVIMDLRVGIQMILKKKNILIKTVLVLISYLLYTNIVLNILNMIGFKYETPSYFIADLLFFLGIVLLYKKELKNNINEYFKNYNIRKKISVIAFWVMVIFGINLVMGVLTEIIFPGLTEDENTSRILSLFSISFMYTIFKTLIFATIAEELVFKKAISDVIDNKVLFVIISSLLYTLMNFMYADLAKTDIGIDILVYFVPAILLSIAYIKNNNNIFIVMLIKFFYNLIPLAILLLVGQ